MRQLRQLKQLKYYIIQKEKLVMKAIKMSQNPQDGKAKTSNKDKNSKMKQYRMGKILKNNINSSPHEQNI